MKYISTRGNAPVLSFEEAMLSGLARDGGLYVPQTIPQMSAADIAALAGQPYEEIAFRVMKPFVGGLFQRCRIDGCHYSCLCEFWPCRARALGAIGPKPSSA
jgi:threonine synthase